MSGTLRITGLASGLDVDSIVKQLMDVENMKLDKVKQDKQVVEWKQEIYRELIGEINTFKSTYFDVLKSDSYMLSPNNYSGFDISSSDLVSTYSGGTITSSISTSATRVTAIAGSGAVSGIYEITNVTLAETAKTQGNAINIKETSNKIAFPVIITKDSNDTIAVNVDGVDYGSIVLDSGAGTKTYNNLQDLAFHINTKLATIKDSDSKELTGKITAVVSDDGTRIEFVRMVEVVDEGDDKNNEITIDLGDEASPYTITLNAGNYTTTSLAAVINEKLKSAKDKDGNIVNIVDKVNADVNITDSMTQINLSKIDNTSIGTYFSKATEVSYGGQKNLMSYDINITASNNSITIVKNREAYTVQIVQGNYSNLQDLINNGINPALSSATKVSDGSTGHDLALSGISISTSPDGTRMIFQNNSGEYLSISGTGAGTLGFSTSVTELTMSLKDRISAFVGGANNGIADFTINGVNFKYNFNTSDKNSTIGDIISDISSKAGVKVTYSELGKKFTLESNTTGSDQIITTTENAPSNFLATLFNIGSGIKIFTGKDAVATIKDPNGVSSTVTKSKNSFTIDGMTYNLLAGFFSGDPTALKPETAVARITVTQNSQKVFDKIKALLDKYNEVIDKISDKIKEKKQYSYKPLTDAQKKEMEADDIKAWEKKAKEGLLSKDANLQNMLYAMRRAFFDSVTGAGISLKDLGISTSTDYTEGGKIVYDEKKLKEAVQNHGTEVQNLFMKNSIISYDADHKTDSGRYGEIGIFRRLSDIITDYTRTGKNRGGYRGILVEKAGIVGQSSEIDNLLYDQIKDYDKRIDNLTQKLIDKENRYYAQYTRLESAMQKFNNQSSWLAQQLLTGSN